MYFMKSIQYSSFYFTNSAKNKETVGLYGLGCGLLLVCASVHHNWRSNFCYMHIIYFSMNAILNHWKLLVCGKFSAVLLCHDISCFSRGNRGLSDDSDCLQTGKQLIGCLSSFQLQALMSRLTSVIWMCSRIINNETEKITNYVTAVCINCW